MANPWILLTSRGQGLLLGALGVGITSVITGNTSALLLAVFFACLPVLAIILVAANRPRFTVTRPSRLETVSVNTRFIHKIQLESRGGIPLTELSMREGLPPQWAGHQPLIMPSSATRRPRSHDFVLTAMGRGRFHLGPLFITITDPFGLAGRSGHTPGTSEVLVLPPVASLDPINPRAATMLTHRSQQLRHSSSDDVLLREYRVGDDVRRIHWRSSARSQQLMVRREERRRKFQTAVLLDSRTSAYPRIGGHSTFEWVVAFAASIAMHCIDKGFEFSLISSGDPLPTREGIASAEPILTALAEINTSPNLSLHQLAEHGWAASSSLAITLTGRLSLADATILIETGSSVKNVAIVCDPYSESVAALNALRNAGWTAVDTRTDKTIAEVWRDALAQGSLS